MPKEECEREEEEVVVGSDDEVNKPEEEVAESPRHRKKKKEKSRKEKKKKEEKKTLDKDDVIGIPEQKGEDENNNNDDDDEKCDSKEVEDKEEDNEAVTITGNEGGEEEEEEEEEDEKKKKKKKEKKSKKVSEKDEDVVDIQEINDSDVPIVFIHGFKGCYLINSKTKKIEWINARKAMGVPEYPNIALPITWQDPETQDRDDIVPGRPIEAVAKVVKFYGGFLKWGHSLKSVTGQSFHPFTWDWRRTPFEAVDRLLDYIAGFNAPCQIIGHSMGATITYVLMLRAYERGGNALLHRLVHSVVFVGPPFKTLPVFLEDTYPGTSTYSKMLDYKTAFTITSSYALFPVYGHDTELGDPEFWIRHKISSYLATVEKPTPAEITHLTNCINLGKKYQEMVATPLPERHPPFTIIAGSKLKTKCSVDIKNPDWKHTEFTMGDGRIPFECATHLPEGVKAEAIYESKKEHAVLCDEIEKIGKSLTLLLDTKRKWATKK